MDKTKAGAGEHRRDEDCTVVDDECVICHVHHGDECPECNGRAFHRDDCSVMKDAHRRRRKRALARARRCFTCESGRKESTGAAPHPCITKGCDAIVCLGDTCAPGYCRACSHDPAWVPLEAL